MRETSSKSHRPPAIEAFIQNQVKLPENFPWLIDAEDEMYLFSLNNLKGNREAAYIRYYSLGKRIFDALGQIVDWRFQSFAKISSFLDFASGYGRFSRYLLQELTPQQIWVSDIYSNAVQFQVNQFGVNGIVSTEYPQNYNANQQFDCIFAASFFSHLPQATFADWLEKLYSLLSDEGILIFSVHDVALLPPDLADSVSGIYFTAQSESRSLDKQLYGTSYVSEAFVSQVFRDKIGKDTPWVRIKKGLCRHQDIYIVLKQPLQDLGKLNFNHHPEGRVDLCKITPTGDIYLMGWAADFNQDSRIEAIQVLVNGKVIQTCLIDCDRPDVATYFNDSVALRSGWSCYIDKAEAVLDDVVMVKAINSRKLERVLDVNTLGVLAHV